MEETLSQFSDRIEVKVHKKIRSRKIFIIILCILLVLLFSYKFIIHQVWLGYYEKYYLSFLERNNLDEGSEDRASSWGYKKYETDNFCGTLEYHAPAKDKFTFSAGLAANMGKPYESYWSIPNDEDDVHYHPYLSANVKWNGKVEYYGDLDFCHDAGGADRQFDMCSFFIKDGEFIFEADGIPKSNKENSDKVLYFKDEIMELKAVIDNEILCVQEH